MQGDTTTQSGDNITERLEKFISADEPQAQDQSATPPSDERQEPDALAETEVEQETEGEGADEQPSLSLTDLSKYLGVDESALDVDENGQLSLKTKVDGQEGKAKLADLLTSYQLRSHLDNETRAAAEQRKAIQAQAAQMAQAVQARVQHVEDLANVAQAELNRQFQNVDWQTLRVTDPAEYAALYQDFQARQAQLNGVMQNVQAQREQFSAQEQQRHQEMMHDLRTRSEQVIAEAIPEWKDPEVRGKEVTELAQTIRSEVERFFGGEADRIMKEIDSGYYGPLPIIWARKAALYDRMQSSKAAVEKKVAAAPKLVKPGQSQPRNTQAQSLRDIKANVKKSGGKDGIVEYLLAAGKV